MKRPGCRRRTGVQKVIWIAVVLQKVARWRSKAGVVCVYAGASLVVYNKPGLSLVLARPTGSSAPDHKVCLHGGFMTARGSHSLTSLILHLSSYPPQDLLAHRDSSCPPQDFLYNPSHTRPRITAPYVPFVNYIHTFFFFSVHSRVNPQMFPLWRVTITRSSVNIFFFFCPWCP